MFVLRRHLSLHRWPAAWLVAIALAVRLLVPAGYMPMAGRAGLEICAPAPTLTFVRIKSTGLTRFARMKSHGCCDLALSQI